MFFVVRPLLVLRLWIQPWLFQLSEAVLFHLDALEKVFIVPVRLRKDLVKILSFVVPELPGFNMDRTSFFESCSSRPVEFLGPTLHTF
jgi:hypothetical protein